MPDANDYNISYNNLNGREQRISLAIGDILFVLGANGSGKSALMAEFCHKNPDTMKKIIAHRKNWLASNISDNTSLGAVNMKINIKNNDLHFESRYKDDQQNYRPSITLHDLIQSENTTARAVQRANNEDNSVLLEQLRRQKSPLEKLNYILQTALLHIEISIGENEFIFAQKDNGETYGIDRLSDGERNAILLSSDVLTASPGTLFLIDEPERHLHRSIISPLLTTLFSERSDCAFVVSTHDVSLPEDNPDSKILIIRSCNWNPSNHQPSGWETDLITSQNEIPEELKHDILGPRRKLLFIEGTDNSLDKSLYQILFPNFSIVPKGSCRDVQRSVEGIRATQSINWIRPFGIIDKDDRSEEEITNLQNNGIYAVPCYSVESLYYSLEMINHVATLQATIIGEIRLEELQNTILSVIANDKDNMVAHVVQRKIRKQVQYPTLNNIRSRENFEYSINVEEEFEREAVRFDELINVRNVNGLIQRYPIKNTRVLDRISSALQFSNRSNYEKAVRKLLQDNEIIRQQIQNLFGDLASQ